MLRTFAGLYAAGMLVRALPVIGVGAVGLGIIGYPVMWLDNTIHFMSDNPALMETTPVELRWQGSESKAIVVKVTNRSGEAWDRFTIECKTDAGEREFTDMSGILPGQTDTRTYVASDSSTMTNVSACKLTRHMRGKPKAFDYAADRERPDGGGWGDRIPEGYRDDIVMPTTDAGASFSGDTLADGMGTGGDYIPADGIMDGN